MKTAHLLRRVIRACVDDERTLQHEQRFVDDARRSGTLGRLVRERRQFLQDLTKLAAPGQSGPTGSWAELLREVGRSLQVAAGGRNSKDAIASCRHSRARTEASYDRALEASWPAETQRVLEFQRGRLQEETRELNGLVV